jgi:uncharacterized protein (TIGR03067 family)
MLVGMLSISVLDDGLVRPPDDPQSPVRITGSLLADQKAKSFEGTWTIFRASGDGVANGKDKNIDLFFRGDAIRIRMLHGSLVGRYRLDATARPKLIDCWTSFVDKHGLHLLDSAVIIKGIYRFEGKTLKICKVEESEADWDPSQKRPTDFNCRPGSGRVLLILRKK